ncbi:hypothetical protein FJV46_10675 [Arthrobacter agilis]|uniref:Gp19/Gp15/Gp42 family protein n=1 Tax=Arthrobacter agilis TaxID=37921 RepID=UPI000B34E585|nr:Gp19/Gp15/Gp42 family protein [Arthrobacter agilis]OUM44161.1 hypothetical protein B8W74_04615 [Arthrobacter agilis]PPB46537.1 hypothetical protein CI784_06910 [Arthrobacter agilis]TPV23808.1 hypothetical protein FJV46_10675 [Arthrobacter agilis]VDR32541.1 Uncharacterised protein [Arthrobacter agilis]
MVTITAQDIANQWRPLSPAETAVVPGLAEQAWVRMLAHPRLSDLEAKLDANPPTVSVATVKSVIASMVIRVLKNPESARQISKSHDDWSRSQTLDSSISTGELYVNDRELDLLDPPPEYSTPGMFVIPLGG